MKKIKGWMLSSIVVAMLLGLVGCTAIGAGIGAIAGSGTSAGAVGGAVIGGVIGYEVGD